MNYAPPEPQAIILNKLQIFTDYYAANIDKDCDRDKALITTTCLNKHLDKILPVMQEK